MVRLQQLMEGLLITLTGLHGIGSHAAPCPRGESEDEKSTSDLETSQPGHFDGSAMAQVIGVFILEFGVLLHRWAYHFLPANRC